MNTTSATSTVARPAAAIQRLRSIDVVRGAVMVLMAIDHVRVYSGVPAGGDTAGVFFTRWVTHFCAPAFVFFAGTSAFLYGRKLGDTRRLAKYLLTRGLMLVALELTFLHVAWTFTFDFTQLLAGVIWMLGWCMILLAGLLWFSTRTIGIIGLTLMIAQNVVGVVPRLLPQGVREATHPLWSFLYLNDSVRFGQHGPEITVLYVIVPWIGVMAAGYAFGTIMVRDDEARRRACLRIGLWATGLFLVLRTLLVIIARPQTSGAMGLLFAFLSPSKYPADQFFLLMTLGPAIALLPLAERARGWLAQALNTFGRVPLFYYLLHIPLIHATSLIVWFLRDGSVRADRFRSAPYVQIPPDQRWSLGLLYLVFALNVALLYAACRWYAGVKARHPQGWLRYI